MTYKELIEKIIEFRKELDDLMEQREKTSKRIKVITGDIQKTLLRKALLDKLEEDHIAEPSKKVTPEVGDNQTLWDFFYKDAAIADSRESQMISKISNYLEERLNDR